MQAVRNLKRVMKPVNGRVVTRDYAVSDFSVEHFAVDGKQEKKSSDATFVSVETAKSIFTR